MESDRTTTIVTAAAMGPALEECFGKGGKAEDAAILGVEVLDAADKPEVGENK